MPRCAGPGLRRWRIPGHQDCSAGLIATRREGPDAGRQSAISHTRLAYLPALDGVRACAVVAVMMFHGGIPHMDGGFMGVDFFFVLSGFLITSLLIGEWRQSLTIKLGAFWARRARRLLPAMLLMLLFVAFLASVIVPRGTYGALRLDALSTLLYVSNWHFTLVIPTTSTGRRPPPRSCTPGHSRWRSSST